MYLIADIQITAYTPSAATQDMEAFMNAAFGTTSDEEMSALSLSLSPAVTPNGSVPNRNTSINSNASSTASVAPPDLSSLAPTPRMTRARENLQPPTDLSKYSINEQDITSPHLSQDSNVLVCRLVKYGGLPTTAAQAVANNLAEKKRKGTLKKLYAKANKDLKPCSTSPPGSPFAVHGTPTNTPKVQLSTFVASDDDDFETIKYVKYDQITGKRLK